MPHLPLAHHETSKRDSSNETEIKVKLLKYLGFKFKHRQVNDSSQSNHETDHLVSHKSNLKFKVPDNDDDMEGLKLDLNRLEAAMEKMGKASALDRSGPVGKEPTGLVPTTHEAIFNHSSRQLHPQWVWITKNSTVGKDGRLGYLGTHEEVRKFGGKARKVFL
jgi:hypothetical protein